jgi:hypothetical protein
VFVSQWVCACGVIPKREPSGDLCALGLCESYPTIAENQFRTLGGGKFNFAVIEYSPANDSVVSDSLADFIPTGEFSLKGRSGSANNSLGQNFREQTLKFRK